MNRQKLLSLGIGLLLISVLTGACTATPTPVPPTLVPATNTPTVQSTVAPTSSPTAVAKFVLTPTRQVPATPPAAKAPGQTPTLTREAAVPGAGATVKGAVWQVTVLSVARMKQLECGSDSTIQPVEGYELLEVVATFAPVTRSEKMSVSTKDAALIDRADETVKALGGGVPSEPAAVGRRSDGCGVAANGRAIVMESKLIQGTLTMSFFFPVEEGRKGYSFQFMDYPPIDLTLFDNTPVGDVNLTSASAVTPVRSSGIGVPMTYKSLTITITDVTRKNTVGETSVVSRQYEAKPGFDFLVVGLTITQTHGMSQQDALADWVNLVMSLYCQSSVADDDNEGSSVALVSSDPAPEHFDLVSCKAGASMPLGMTLGETEAHYYLTYAVKESASAFRLRFEEQLGLQELDLAEVSAP